MEFRRAAVAETLRSWRRLYRVPVVSERTRPKCLWSSSVQFHAVYMHARTKRASFPALFSARHVHTPTYVRTCVRVFRARKFDARNELSRPEGARGCLAISKRLVSAIRRRKNRKNDRGLIFFSRRFFSF